MSSSVNRGSMKSAVGGDSGGADNQFPAGLRVLVVDDDPTCLAILERMLRSCLYDVTKCNRAEIALSLLRGNKSGFDIVISDVHMPDMDGFKLLECIGLEMDLPVIMMSADDGKAVVMKGVTHGACDYLIKPVRMEALKNIWQHVVRKRKHEWKDLEQSGSVEDGDRQAKPAEDADYSSSANEGNWRNSKKRKDDDEEADDRDDTSSLKKPRVVWSVELHQQFVAAVNQLGIDKAVPKKILELMNVPGLTRENVASHLQKYRLYLRRISGVSNQGGLSNPFMGAQDGSFGPMSSFNGLDLQAIASSAQIPAQSLATLQAAALGRGNTRSGIAMPVGDQRIFSFENPKLRFGEGHQQQQLTANNNKQMNLLHGIPTTMEAKQLTSLQHPTHSFGNVNMPVNSPGSHGNSLLMQMSQPQSRGQLPNDSTGSNTSRLTSSGLPIIPNGVVGGVIQARNGIMEDGCGTGYNPISHAPSAINFPINISEVSVNGFPLGSTPGLSNVASKGTFHEEAISEIKVSRSYAPSYDIFNEFQHQKLQDWELRSGGLNFDASQHAGSLHGSMDVLPSVIVQQQGFTSSQKVGQNAFMIGRTLYSSGEGSQLGSPQIADQNVNSRYLDNSRKVKAESFHDVSCDNSLLTDHYGQEDLMSALLKPQQEGNSDIVGEFDYDGYPMGNISV